MAFAFAIAFAPIDRSMDRFSCHICIRFRIHVRHSNLWKHHHVSTCFSNFACIRITAYHVYEILALEDGLLTWKNTANCLPVLSFRAGKVTALPPVFSSVPKCQTGSGGEDTYACNVDSPNILIYSEAMLL